MVNETGFRATVHINKFVTFWIRTLQLEILKNSQIIAFKMTKHFRCACEFHI